MKHDSYSTISVEEIFMKQFWKWYNDTKNAVQSSQFERVPITILLIHSR